MALVFFVMLAVSQGGYIELRRRGDRGALPGALADGDRAAHRLPGRPARSACWSAAGSPIAPGAITRWSAAASCWSRWFAPGAAADAAARAGHASLFALRRLVLGRGRAVARHDGARGDARRARAARCSASSRRASTSAASSAPLLFGLVLDYGRPGPGILDGRGAQSPDPARRLRHRALRPAASHGSRASLTIEPRPPNAPFGMSCEQRAGVEISGVARVHQIIEAAFLQVSSRHEFRSPIGLGPP